MRGYPNESMLCQIQYFPRVPGVSGRNNKKCPSVVCLSHSISVRHYYDGAFNFDAPYDPGRMTPVLPRVSIVSTQTLALGQTPLSGVPCLLTACFMYDHQSLSRIPVRLLRCPSIAWQYGGGTRPPDYYYSSSGLPCSLFLASSATKKCVEIWVKLNQYGQILQAVLLSLRLCYAVSNLKATAELLGDIFSSTGE